MYLVDNNTLDFFWHSLQEEIKVPHFNTAIKITEDIANKGWAFKYEVEDLIECMDARINVFEFNLTDFMKHIGIHWEVVYDKPKQKSSGVSGCEAIRVEDVAFLLIIFERLGFRTEPGLLVDSLLPTISKQEKKILSSSELEIFWYYKERYKNSPISLGVNEDFLFGETIKKFKNNDKYLIELIADKTGNATILKVTPPKFRRRPNPIRTTCEQCGIEYHKGDPESSAMHRREHKKRMVYLDPKPHLEIIEESKSNSEPELVTANSPLWKHKEMYIRALAFKREFSYDLIQWGTPKDSDPHVHGFLFTNAIDAIIGACCFRRRIKDDKNTYWILDWIWICPSERRKGHLTFRWKKFRKQFGDFYVSTPVSDEMRAFLAKRNELFLLQIL
jgi:hypothetical protein